MISRGIEVIINSLNIRSEIWRRSLKINIYLEKISKQFKHLHLFAFYWRSFIILKTFCVYGLEVWECYEDIIFVISILALFQIRLEKLINFVLILLAVMLKLLSEIIIVSGNAEAFIGNNYYEKVVGQKDKKDT